jgi:hypothetical protein
MGFSNEGGPSRTDGIGVLEDQMKLRGLPTLRRIVRRLSVQYGAVPHLASHYHVHVNVSAVLSAIYECDSSPLLRREHFNMTALQASFT